MTDEKIIVQVDPDLEDLIPGFLENRNEDVNKLKAALEAKDLESLRSIGHSLKGVGGGYGFELMSQIGAEIENAAKQGDEDNIKVKIEQLDDYLKRVQVKYD